MNASRAPTVQESNGRYAVAIAPGVVLRWWFELRDTDLALAPAGRGFS